MLKPKNKNTQLLNKLDQENKELKNIIKKLETENTRTKQQIKKKEIMLNEIEKYKIEYEAK